MRNSSLIGVAFLSLAVVLLGNGCGAKSPSGALAGLTTKFQSADPMLKAKAEAAAAQFKTNNYVGTVVSLRELKAAPGVAPKQQVAIDGAMDAVLGKMFDRASKGDPQALEARDTLRQLQRRPGAN